jgi:hypothetical protein
MLPGQRLLLDHKHSGNEPALHKGFTISAYYDLCASFLEHLEDRCHLMKDAWGPASDYHYKPGKESMPAATK